MFSAPEYLYLLLFAPIFFIFFILRLKARKRLLQAHIHDVCLKAITNSADLSKYVCKQSLLFMVFVCLILSLSRPQSPHKENIEREVKGAEVMLLADVSKSMLVQDMGGLSRLEVMKKELDKLIHQLVGQRVGLISFAGSSVLVSPLTLDHSSLELFLKNLSPEDHVFQGSDFGLALRSAGQALKRGSALAPRSSARIILLASDGEDNEQTALKVTKEIVDQNIRIWTLGLGTQKGGLIPLYNKQGDKIAYKKDKKTGKPLISKFNENTLKQIAQKGQGAFYVAGLGTDTVKKIYADIQAVGEGASSSQSQNQQKEWYQYYVLAGLIFGALYFLIGEKKKTSWRAWQDVNNFLE